LKQKREVIQYRVFTITRIFLENREVFNDHLYCIEIGDREIFLELSLWIFRWIIFCIFK